jgi:hypothetical protein
LRALDGEADGADGLTPLMLFVWTGGGGFFILVAVPVGGLAMTVAISPSVAICRAPPAVLFVAADYSERLLPSNGRDLVGDDAEPARIVRGTGSAGKLGCGGFMRYLMDVLSLRRSRDGSDSDRTNCKGVEDECVECDFWW